MLKTMIIKAMTPATKEVIGIFILFRVHKARNQD
jgi:hypothetical protein